MGNAQPRIFQVRSHMTDVAICSYCGNESVLRGTGENWRCATCGNDDYDLADEEGEQVIWDSDEYDVDGDELEIGV